MLQEPSSARRRAWEDPCQALGELCADAALCAQLALPRREFIQLHRCSQVPVLLAYVHKWASPEATVVHSAVKILQGGLIASLAMRQRGPATPLGQVIV